MPLHQHHPYSLSYESMQALCERFNSAVDQLRQLVRLLCCLVSLPHIHPPSMTRILYHPSFICIIHPSTRHISHLSIISDIYSSIHPYINHIFVRSRVKQTYSFIYQLHEYINVFIKYAFSSIHSSISLLPNVAICWFSHSNTCSAHCLYLTVTLSNAPNVPSL